MTYLDANATEPLRPEARAAMLAALDCVGNPASVHAAGNAARRLLEDARDTIARHFSVASASVIFTSGGTEADALAIHALGAGRRVIAGATEHDAIRAAAPGATVLPVDRNGVADLEVLARLLAEGTPSLVCLMLANNETGTLQPIAEAAALCRRHDALLHVDAVQGRGAVPHGADSLAISSHKLGGPAGAGALLLKNDLPIAPLIRGGGQERGRRGGTPPVAAIAGFAAALTCPENHGLTALRDRAEQAAQACGAIACGAGARRLANTTCLALPGIAAQTQIIALDLAGIAVSAGAACSSGRVARSHVLDAMGLAELAGQAIRVSLPWNAQTSDIDAFIDAYSAMAARLARRAALSHIAVMHLRPNRPVYLDNQATTPCDPRVVEAMLPWFTEQFGNPHSLEHQLGRNAEAAVAAERAEVAALIGASPSEIVFTSGATESNNIAIKGAAKFARRMENPRKRIITLATEHKCVLESVRDLAADGFEPVILPVGADGMLDHAVLAAALAVPTLLVSVMAVNNETGTIHDLSPISELVHQAGALLHCDAAQACGKIPLDVNEPRIDLLSLSGHKIYGPKGIGALYVRRRPRVRLDPLLSGGGQERGLRPGTLPAPLIVGLGAACRIAGAEMGEEAARIRAHRDRLLALLQAGIPGLRVNGDPIRRIPGNLNLTFPNATAAQVMAAAPDLCVSTGSACSSAAIEPSYVLSALGLDADAAARSLRIGIGRFTSPADIDFAAAALIAGQC